MFAEGCKTDMLNMLSLQFHIFFIYVVWIIHLARLLNRSRSGVEKNKEPITDVTQVFFFCLGRNDPVRTCKEGADSSMTPH